MQRQKLPECIQKSLSFRKLDLSTAIFHYFWAAFGTKLLFKKKKTLNVMILALGSAV
jgi:hypothetical protein